MNAVVEHVEHVPSNGQLQQLSEQTVLLQVIQRAASDPSVDLDRMERLLVMHERLTAKRAEQQFIEAMARFKSNPPKVIKDKTVRITTDRGVIEYRHASLGAVVDAAISGLGAVGISHRWDIARKDGRIHVTCVLTHTGGHSTSTTLDGAPDDSGKKNAIQQTASTVTYLQRYTLLAATGLASEEGDDDGQGGAPEVERPEPPEGYEQWKADMRAIDNYSAFGKAWKGADEKFRGYVNAHDPRWFDEHKASLSAKLVKQ